MIIKTGKIENLYATILKNKLITICALFTIFTLIDTALILLGLYPPKTGLGPYVHLLGRLILQSLLIVGLFIFNILNKKIKNGFIVYITTFILTYSSLIIYVWSNSFFTTLHPNAYRDVTRSYIFMYLLLGIIIYFRKITGKVLANIKR